MGTIAVALNEKDCGGGAVHERWLLADKREPAERMLSICAVRGGNSTALLLPVLLLDALERARARLDVVSRRCWRCFFVEVDSKVWVLLPVAGGCGIGFSPPLVSLPSEHEVMEVRRRRPIAVSDLYRGRVRGISVVDALTPADAEDDRRRPSVDGTGMMVSGCVVGEVDMGKEVDISESEV